MHIVRFDGKPYICLLSKSGKSYERLSFYGFIRACWQGVALQVGTVKVR